MPTFIQDTLNSSIEFVLFKGGNGVAFPFPNSSTISVPAGKYTCLFRYVKRMFTPHIPIFNPAPIDFRSNTISESARNSIITFPPDLNLQTPILLQEDQIWVKKLETPTTRSLWTIHNQSRILIDCQIDIDLEVGNPIQLTVGITSNCKEYVSGSNKSPEIISKSILIQPVIVSLWQTPSSSSITVTPTGTITTTTPTPTPTPTRSTPPSLVAGIKEPVIPIVIGNTTPTPSKPVVPAYNPILSKITFKTLLDSVSPILDTQQLSYSVVKNIINHYDSETMVDSESAKNGGLAVAKYITKPVRLLEDNLASGFFISFSANIPEEANVYIFHKIYNTIEDQSLSEFEEQPWIFHATTGSRKSQDKKEFLDFEFPLETITYPSNTAITQFDMFSIKIVMTSTNSSRVPKIKDFRVMAHS